MVRRRRTHTAAARAERDACSCRPPRAAKLYIVLCTGRSTGPGSDQPDADAASLFSGKMGTEIRIYSYTKDLPWRVWDSPFRELLSNERLAGHQHFGFKLYNNSQDSDSSVLACDANGSVTIHFNQISVGPDTGPISIVLYVNVTFIKRDIPNRPVYRKLYNMLYSRLHHLLN